MNADKGTGAEYDRCPHCGGEVTQDSDFCPHCGVLFDAAGHPHCDAHPRNTAVGVCIICRTLVCKECSTMAQGRTRCRDHKNVEVLQDWARVFQSTEIGDAELVKSVLESAGFRVQVQNFNSVGFIWDGGGDSPISRSNINKPAKVFVPIPEYDRAVGAVAEWKGAEGVSENPD